VDSLCWVDNLRGTDLRIQPFWCCIEYVQLQHYYPYKLWTWHWIEQKINAFRAGWKFYCDWEPWVSKWTTFAYVISFNCNLWTLQLKDKEFCSAARTKIKLSSVCWVITQPTGATGCLKYYSQSCKLQTNMVSQNGTMSISLEAGVPQQLELLQGLGIRSHRDNHYECTSVVYVNYSVTVANSIVFKFQLLCIHT